MLESQQIRRILTVQHFQTTTTTKPKDAPCSTESNIVPDTSDSTVHIYTTTDDYYAYEQSVAHAPGSLALDAPPKLGWSSCVWSQ
jgi:hypothetical protein